MIRRYLDIDAPHLSHMLRTEGLKDEEMYFAKNQTWVVDGAENVPIGFFTFRMEGKFPYMVHFCMRRDKRGFLRARWLAKQFTETMRRFKFKAFIGNVKCGDAKIKALVNFQFKKAKFYAVSDGLEFFITEI